MTTSLDFGVGEELALVERKIRESIVSDESLLTDIASYVIGSGGKRIRPLVTLLSFQALGGKDVRQAVDLATAVELTANACAALAEGEIRQKRHAYDVDVDRDEYLDIIRRKTALPIMAGAKIAGLLAGARLELVDAVGEYGLNLGIAFQIVDDILDVIGDGARLGKPSGTDIKEGNVTLVAIHALNNGSTIDHAELTRIIRKRRKDETEIRQALGMIQESGAVEKARVDARSFGSLAKKALDELPDTEAKGNLLRLGE